MLVHILAIAEVPLSKALTPDTARWGAVARVAANSFISSTLHLC